MDLQRTFLAYVIISIFLDLIGAVLTGGLICLSY